MPDPFLIFTMVIQSGFNGCLLVPPDLQRDTLGGKFPDGDSWVGFVFGSAFQLRCFIGMIHQTNASQLFLNGALPEGDQHQDRDGDTAADQVGGKDILRRKFCHGRNELNTLCDCCDVSLRTSNQDSSQNIQHNKNQFDGCVVGGVQSGQDVLQTDFGVNGFRGFHVFPPG